MGRFSGHSSKAPEAPAGWDFTRSTAATESDGGPWSCPLSALCLGLTPSTCGSHDRCRALRVRPCDTFRPRGAGLERVACIGSIRGQETRSQAAVRVPATWSRTVE